MPADGQKQRLLLEARVRLSRVALHGTLDELLQETLDSAERLSGSLIGFFHFVDPDQQNLTLQAWSTNTLRHMCTAEGKHQHYAINRAGVWVEAFHTRAPVIHNDYAALMHRRGMPEGHATITRELIVPMLRDDLVTAIIGVGNKPTDYDSDDVEALEELLSLTMDMVDRKRAEAALVASEARFRGLFDRMTQGVVYSLSDGTITSANPAALKILGLAPDELADRGLLDPRWRAVREDGSPLPTDEFPVVVAQSTGVEVPEVVFGLHTADRDDVVWLRTSAVPMFRPGEAVPFGSFSTFEDVTQRRRAEQERLRSIEREHRMQRLESAGMFAGGIAHDFNNLLTTILGNAETASEETPSNSPVRADLEQIILAGRRAASLTRQMLAVSGKSLFAPSSVSLPTLMQVALPSIATTFPTGVTLVSSPALSAAAEPSTIAADPDQLRRLIGNLMTNAAEAVAAESGEVRVAWGVVECGRAELEPFVAGDSLEPGTYFYIDLEDDGPGMDAATLARIFDPFFSTKFVGRGLGIPESLGIARAHGGSLRFTSAPGQGTRVRLLLPVEQPRDARASRERISVSSVPPAIEHGDTRVVLVVDDEPSLRRFVGKILENAGYEVLLACDGRQAVDLYAMHARRIALVLLDLTMPVLDGDSALRELRDLDPQVRVIVSSGYSELELKDRFSRRAVSGFLPKPYTAAQLRAKVKELIS